MLVLWPHQGDGSLLQTSRGRSGSGRERLTEESKRGNILNIQYFPPPILPSLLSLPPLPTPRHPPLLPFLSLASLPSCPPPPPPLLTAVELLEKAVASSVLDRATVDEVPTDNALGEDSTEEDDLLVGCVNALPITPAALPTNCTPVWEGEWGRVGERVRRGKGRGTEKERRERDGEGEEGEGGGCPEQAPISKQAH